MRNQGEDSDGSDEEALNEGFHAEEPVCQLLVSLTERPVEFIDWVCPIEGVEPVVSPPVWVEA
jgi:hypothetical protein